MKLQEALIAFDALSQETRLKAFRILVEIGLDGINAGHLSEKLNIPHNTMSFHLNHMSHANLIQSEKKGRLVIYKANFLFVQALIRFMVQNCCNKDFVDIKKDKRQACELIELFDCSSAQVNMNGQQNVKDLVKQKYYEIAMQNNK